MYWLGLVAGWIVAFKPDLLAALATAVPILWKSDPGFEVAMPTVWALAAPVSEMPSATTPAARKCLIPVSS